jgi:predicted Rossmann fold flavoprotein
MKLAVIGASGAGLPFASFLLKKHPDYEVTLFDGNEKIGKKLLATGNGHCNLLNVKASPDSYNDPDFVSPVLKRFHYSDIEEALLSIGVSLMRIGDLAYPQSYTASGYVSALTSFISSHNGIFRLGTRVEEYKKEGNKWLLRTNHGDFAFDKLVFCSGGKSGRNLGSDGSLFPVFATHGYSLTSLKPGLCPMKVKENVSSLNGLRHEALVSLLKEGQEIYRERGEVLFKNDGLSGIVIFNVEREATRKKGDAVSLDLFPERSAKDLEETVITLFKSNPSFGASFLPLPLFEYCLKEACVKDLDSLERSHDFAFALKNLSFSISGLYDFRDSQVTLGGISLSCVSSKNLESKLEENVYFLGEVLDVDGPCGGYNLGWCLASSLALASSL